MALTAEEEAKVKKIITAYNRKRIKKLLTKKHKVTSILAVSPQLSIIYLRTNTRPF